MSNNKRVVVACDSFKGTMSASEVCIIIKNALCDKDPSLEVITVPVADGGEGTVDCFHAALGGRIIHTEVSSPLMRAVDASWWLSDDGEVAVIEVAQASGINTDGGDKDALSATSYGTGELILAALDMGVRRFFIGLGGSATTDGGTGILRALGTRFVDARGDTINHGGAALNYLDYIDLTNLDPRLSECEFTALCDVTNELYGENGAAYVFSPQKGADTEEKMVVLDSGLRRFADVCRKQNIQGYEFHTGAGAAGGIGFGLMTFLNAKLKSGIDAILELTDFENITKDAFCVITGEGKLDLQTFSGKVPMGVVKKSHALYNIAISGLCEVEKSKITELGFDGVYETNPQHLPFEQIKPTCREDLYATAKSINLAFDGQTV